MIYTAFSVLLSHYPSQNSCNNTCLWTESTQEEDKDTKKKKKKEKKKKKKKEEEEEEEEEEEKEEEKKTPQPTVGIPSRWPHFC